MDEAELNKRIIELFETLERKEQAEMIAELLSLGVSDFIEKYFDKRGFLGSAERVS